MDQTALGHRERLGRVHRKDGDEGCAGAESTPRIVDRAKRCGGVDHHADVVAALQPRIAIEVDRVSERRIGQQHRDAIAITGEQLFLDLGIGAPVVGIDVRDQRSQPRPFGSLCGRGEGQPWHQRQPLAPPRRVANRDHQSQRRVGDRKAGAAAAEQSLGRFRLESAHFGTVVRINARGLDPAQRIEMLAQSGRARGDQRKASHRR